MKLAKKQVGTLRIDAQLHKRVMKHKALLYKRGYKLDLSRVLEIALEELLLKIGEGP